MIIAKLRRQTPLPFIPNYHHQSVHRVLFDWYPTNRGIFVNCLKQKYKFQDDSLKKWHFIKKDVYELALQHQFPTVNELYNSKKEIIRLVQAEEISVLSLPKTRNTRITILSSIAAKIRRPASSNLSHEM